jgi:hypothetical protein
VLVLDRAITFPLLEKPSDGTQNARMNIFFSWSLHGSDRNCDEGIDIAAVRYRVLNTLEYHHIYSFVEETEHYNIYIYIYIYAILLWGPVLKSFMRELKRSTTSTLLERDQK